MKNRIRLDHYWNKENVWLEILCIFGFFVAAAGERWAVAAIICIAYWCGRRLIQIRNLLVLLAEMLSPPEHNLKEILAAKNGEVIQSDRRKSSPPGS